MKEVEQLVYARMIADTVTGGLVPLLGSVDRILHAYQSNVPPAPGLTFQIWNSVPGTLTGDFIRTHEIFIQFNIFSNSYPDIAFRLKRLFDGYCFTVPGNYLEIGAVSSVFDWEDTDGFDEQLQIQRKDLRFRFFVVPKAQSPI
jgi:hypothetical protein